MNRLPWIVLITWLMGWVIVLVGVVIFGPGTLDYRFWDSQSWQTIATGVTGMFLALLAALAWVVQKQQVELLNLQQDLLYGISPTLYSLQEPGIKRLTTRNPVLLRQLPLPPGHPIGTPAPEFREFSRGVCWTIRIVNNAATPITYVGYDLYEVRDEEELSIEDTAGFSVDFEASEVTSYASRNQPIGPYGALALTIQLPDDYPLPEGVKVRLRIRVTYIRLYPPNNTAEQTICLDNEYFTPSK